MKKNLPFFASHIIILLQDIFFYFLSSKVTRVVGKRSDKRKKNRQQEITLSYKRINQNVNHFLGAIQIIINNTFSF